MQFVNFVVPINFIHLLCMCSFYNDVFFFHFIIFDTINLQILYNVIIEKLVNLAPRLIGSC